MKMPGVLFLLGIIVTNCALVGIISEDRNIIIRY